VQPGQLKIAMLSIHSNPIGELGTKDTGGMSVYIRELARELGSHGHRIDIFTGPQGDGDAPIIHLYDNVRLIHLGISNDGNLSKLNLYPYLPELFKTLEKFRQDQNLTYDLIHSHYWLSGRVGTWAQNLWSRPHLVMFHTLGKAKNKTGVGMQEPALRIATEKKIMETCDCILAPTERERKNLIDDYGAAADKIGVVPCGVNLDLFQPGDKSAARRKLGFAPNDLILLYIGRFEPQKGLNRLMEAMTYLHSGMRFRLVIVGGDGDQTPESQHLKRKSTTLGIDDRVLFAGRIEQKKLPPYYHAADVLVIPSHYESFGLVGLEALACGKPVVSTPVGAMKRLIKDNRAGCVVADTSPQSLAQAIQSICADFSPYAEEVIRQSALAYGWSNVASAIIAEYKSVIRQQFFEDTRRVRAKASCGRLVPGYQTTVAFDT
jgi:D-inositol-3-phosphate glycosyltransferase